MLDFTTPFGAHALERLNKEEVIWLVSVDERGTPQPVPVWFLWHEGAFLIYTMPASHKVPNLQRNPRAALHFSADAQGDDVVVFTGAAELGPQVSAEAAALYLQKYAEGIARLGSTPEEFAREYSLAIRVVPEKLRGF